MSTFWSGRSATVVKGGVSYPFKSWELSVDRSKIDITYFGVAGAWRRFLAGFRAGTIKLAGPLDTDMTLINDDDAITIILTVGSSNTVTVSCVVTKNNFKQDIDDAARYDVEAAVDGQPVFTFGA